MENLNANTPKQDEEDSLVYFTPIGGGTDTPSGRPASFFTPNQEAGPGDEDIIMGAEEEIAAAEDNDDVPVGAEDVFAPPDDDDEDFAAAPGVEDAGDAVADAADVDDDVQAVSGGAAAKPKPPAFDLSVLTGALQDAEGEPVAPGFSAAIAYLALAGMERIADIEKIAAMEEEPQEKLCKLLECKYGHFTVQQIEKIEELRRKGHTSKEQSDDLQWVYAYANGGWIVKIDMEAPFGISRVVDSAPAVPTDKLLGWFYIASVLAFYIAKGKLTMVNSVDHYKDKLASLVTHDLYVRGRGKLIANVCVNEEGLTPFFKEFEQQVREMGAINFKPIDAAKTVSLAWDELMDDKKKAPSPASAASSETASTVESFHNLSPRAQMMVSSMYKALGKEARKVEESVLQGLKLELDKVEFANERRHGENQEALTKAEDNNERRHYENMGQHAEVKTAVLEGLKRLQQEGQAHTQMLQQQAQQNAQQNAQQTQSIAQLTAKALENASMARTLLVLGKRAEIDLLDDDLGSLVGNAPSPNDNGAGGLPNDAAGLPNEDDAEDLPPDGWRQAAPEDFRSASGENPVSVLFKENKEAWKNKEAGKIKEDGKIIGFKSGWCEVQGSEKKKRPSKLFVRKQ